MYQSITLRNRFTALQKVRGLLLDVCLLSILDGGKYDADKGSQGHSCKKLHALSANSGLADAGGSASGPHSAAV